MTSCQLENNKTIVEVNKKITKVEKKIVKVEKKIVEFVNVKKIKEKKQKNTNTVFYLVGDPDQTIHEYAGSDAEWFHKAAAHPYDELEQGLRCGRAINEFCKKIIAPIWKHYEYEGGGRTWLPAVYNKKYHEIPEGCKEGDTIEGNIYPLTGFEPSKIGT